ncbi:MAG: hypothetical protein KGI08_08460, partial [Thaumarchaeota archaeon]|nr:hypothetical protein [Nitrososphaerota archaeon]
MSWSTGLIVLVIFIALISFYGNQFSTVLTNYSSNLQTTAVQNANAKALAPNTSSPGTVICDLHITFKPQFNEQNAFSISSAQWQINGGASYNWFNCNVVGGLKQQSWIPQVDNFYYQLGTASKKKMDLISLGQTLHLNLVMTGKDGSVKSYQNDPFLT